MSSKPAHWPDLAAIKAAATLLEGQIVRTPTLAAPRLSALTGADCVVKFENMQVTGSFKERGAYVKMSRLDAEARKKGVIAMSAGNHAQAVAYHAQRLGIPATIVMPEATPQVKVENTARFGAEVILKGETLAESQAEVERLIAQRGLVLVHPYDDPDVVAGQGTIGLEMLADFPDLDCLVVPMGGGGLISGVALAAKALKPSIEIVGVEVASYPSFHNAMTGSSLSIGGPTLAEGIAVKYVGKLTLEIAKSLVTGPILVPESAVERAVDAFANHQRSMAEGAGAAGLAALLHEPRASGAGRSGSSCAAGISMRASSPPSWCANSSASSGSSPSASPPMTGRLPRSRGDPPRRTRRQHSGSHASPHLPLRARERRVTRRDGGDARRAACGADLRCARCGRAQPATD